MRFTTARLCGSEALMAIPADLLDLDVQGCIGMLENVGATMRCVESCMLQFDWNGMEVTLYPSGKVMFFPVKDKQMCIRYATEILSKVI